MSALHRLRQTLGILAFLPLPALIFLLLIQAGRIYAQLTDPSASDVWERVLQTPALTVAFGVQWLLMLAAAAVGVRRSAEFVGIYAALASLLWACYLLMDDVGSWSRIASSPLGASLLKYPWIAASLLSVAYLAWAWSIPQKERRLAESAPRGASPERAGRLLLETLHFAALTTIMLSAAGMIFLAREETHLLLQNTSWADLGEKLRRVQFLAYSALPLLLSASVIGRSAHRRIERWIIEAAAVAASIGLARYAGNEELLNRLTVGTAESRAAAVLCVASAPAFAWLAAYLAFTGKRREREASS